MLVHCGGGVLTKIQATMQIREGAKNRLRGGGTVGYDVVITQNLFQSMDFNNFSTSFALFARNWRKCKKKFKKNSKKKKKSWKKNFEKFLKKKISRKKFFFDFFLKFFFTFSSIPRKKRKTGQKIIKIHRLEQILSYYHIKGCFGPLCRLTWPDISQILPCSSLASWTGAG